jgi:hypothetical protein
VLAVAFIASRLIYYALGVRFNASSLGFYLQYIDPELLRTAFWQSLYYLKEQPPGYNFLLGAVLRLFPGHTDAAFHALHLILGFAMECALFSVLVRVGLRPALALFASVVFAVNPLTVLYENWLFYSYVITAVFVLAAWTLHRYASHGRLADGFGFFLSLFSLGMIRTIYHPVWFVLTALLLIGALPHSRLRTAKAAALPALLFAALYLKHFAVFGGFVIGSEVFQSSNLVLMAASGAPKDAIAKLEALGRVSPILSIQVYESAPQAYASFIPEPPKTGIAVLDQAARSTGASNWNSLWMGKVGAQYLKDALVLIGEHPEVYIRNLLGNVPRYFKAANWDWPFDGTKHPNSATLETPLRVNSLLTSGTSRSQGVPWWSFIWMPVVLAFPVWKAWRLIWPGTRGGAATALDATTVTAIFAVANILYAAMVTIAFSAGDHNRYRDEVSGLFALLLGLAIADVDALSSRRPIERRRPAIPGLTGTGENAKGETEDQVVAGEGEQVIGQPVNAHHDQNR